jgi:hypothetical protein
LKQCDLFHSQVHAKLQDGSAPVTGLDFSAFFYSNNGFDPDNGNSGLLRSPLLLHICVLFLIVLHAESTCFPRSSNTSSYYLLLGMTRLDKIKSREAR